MTHEWKKKCFSSVLWLVNDLFNWFTSVPWLINDSFKWFISMPWLKKMVHISAMNHEWWVMALKCFTSVPWLMNDLFKWFVSMPWLINDECDSHSLIDISAMTHEWENKWKKNDSRQCQDSWMKGAWCTEMIHISAIASVCCAFLNDRTAAMLMRPTCMQVSATDVYASIRGPLRPTCMQVSVVHNISTTCHARARHD